MHSHNMTGDLKCKKQSYLKAERQMKRVQHKVIEKKVLNKTCRVVITLLCIATISHHAQHALFQSPFNLLNNAHAFYHSILNSRKKMNEVHCRKTSKLFTRYSRTPSDKKKRSGNTQHRKYTLHGKDLKASCLSCPEMDLFNLYSF